MAAQNNRHLKIHGLEASALEFPTWRNVTLSRTGSNLIKDKLILLQKHLLISQLQTIALIYMYIKYC